MVKELVVVAVSVTCGECGGAGKFLNINEASSNADKVIHFIF